MFNGHIPTGDIDMKYRTILLILALSTFTLFGCGKTETNIPETSIEEEITDTTTDADESNKEADAEVLETDATESEESMLSSDTSPLDPSNITVNPDGTYSFTDDFLVAVQGINGASALTDANLNDALQEAAAAIKNIGLTDERDIVDIIETVIGIRKYDQQNQQNQQQQATTSGQDQVAPGPVDEVGAMDGMFGQEEDITGTHGAGDGTHVGTSHSEGAMDDVIAGLLQEGPGDMTLGEGDGTHVGISHSEGPLDSMFNFEDGTGDMTLGEGDGTHVGIGH